MKSSLIKVCLIVLFIISAARASHLYRAGYYSKPVIESSMNSYDDRYVCKNCHIYEKIFIPFTYLLSQLFFGTYFLLSAFFCAVLSTCSSYSTVYVTVSVTSSSTSSTSTTTFTTTTSTSSTTTVTTSSLTDTATTSTTLEASATTTTALTITQSTTTSPITTTTATSTTTVGITTNTVTLSTTVESTTTTTTRTNGNGRTMNLDDEFWKGILNGDSDEILPTEVLPNEQFTTLPDSD